MGDFARKADGRRVFMADFKRGTVERVGSSSISLTITSS